MRTATGLPLLKAFECGTVVGFNVPPGCICHLPARDNDDVYSCQWFTASKQLSNKPFGPVTDDRIPDSLAGRNAEAGRPDLVRQGEAGHEPASIPAAVVIDLRELRPAAQFHRCDVTARRLRPFARRRFSTVRPFLVAMRTRNPCVRRRRRRLG